MSRLRRFSLPLLLILPAIGLCGKLLLTPVYASVIVAFANPGGPIVKDIPQRGWPWLYQQVDGQDWSFRGWPLVADLAVLLTILAICWLMLNSWWRRCDYRFRFSLRASLLFMVVPAACLGWWMSHSRSWREEQRHIEQFDGVAAADAMTFVGYEWLRRLCSAEQLQIFDRATTLDIGTILLDRKISEEKAAVVLAAIPHMPYLKSINCEGVVESTGDDGKPHTSPVIVPARIPNVSIFDDVECMAFDYGFDEPFMERDEYLDYDTWPSECANDETLLVIGKLERLKALSLSECNVTDVGLSNLKNCRSLRRIRLLHTRISDRGLKALPVEHLQELSLGRCNISDAGLEHLARCHQLESLSLAHTKITDAGLKRLTHLQKLKNLDLSSTAITDNAIESLVQFKSLENLRLTGCTAITDRHLMRLLEIPGLYNLDLPTLPDEPINQRTQREQVLLDRFYQRMGVD